MTAPNGGPAFPLGAKWDDEEESFELPQTTYQGMTLRDYFAAKAMQAIVSSESSEWPFGIDACSLAEDVVGVGNASVDFEAAICAYTIADAMLAAREKGGVE